MEFRTTEESERKHILLENVKKLMPSGPQIEKRVTHNTQRSCQRLVCRGIIVPPSPTFLEEASRALGGEHNTRGKVCIYVIPVAV